MKLSWFTPALVGTNQMKVQVKRVQIVVPVFIPIKWIQTKETQKPWDVRWIISSMALRQTFFFFLFCFLCRFCLVFIACLLSFSLLLVFRVTPTYHFCFISCHLWLYFTFSHFRNCHFSLFFSLSTGLLLSSVQIVTQFSYTQRGFAGGLDGCRSPSHVMPETLATSWRKMEIKLNAKRWPCFPHSILPAENKSESWLCWWHSCIYCHTLFST